MSVAEGEGRYPSPGGLGTQVPCLGRLRGTLPRDLSDDAFHVTSREVYFKMSVTCWSKIVSYIAVSKLHSELDTRNLTGDTRLNSKLETKAAVLFDLGNH